MRITQRIRGHADRRIVVVDESGDVQKVFRRYFDGYQVLSVDNLPGIRRHPKDGPLHAVVLGSASAQSQWKAASVVPTELRKLPIISCSLHTARQTADDLGVAGYLVKPVTREQIRSLLRRVVWPVRKAMIVDDDNEMLSLLSRMIRSLARGCEVWTAGNGRDAIHLARAHHPDVVFLDLLMPEVNGYAVIDALRLDPDLQATPIIVVTARGMQDETVVASTISVYREGGLTIAETMRWLRSGLDALLDPTGSAPKPLPETTGSPASPETR